MTRILVADDHDVVRSGVAAILSSQPGWEVVAEAEDGKQAIELAAKLRPDVAVIDFQLPIVNGVEATREIRTARPETEVLIFSMYESEPLVRDLLAAGARGYVLKSETRRFLIPAIDSLSRHQPFFTGRIYETLVLSYLARGASSGEVPTPRERHVIQLIAEGHTNKVAARILGINPKTVETHRASVMRKIDARSTADLVRYAIRNKLIQP